jgi:retron-type reverse transcriptase
VSDLRSQLRSAESRCRQRKVKQKTGADPSTPSSRHVGTSDQKYYRMKGETYRLGRDLQRGKLSKRSRALAERLDLVAVDSWLLERRWTWKRGPNNEFDRSPGKSGIKLSDIEREGQKWTTCRFLSRVASTGNYQPSPYRRVWLPKPGSCKRRPIDIPEVWDWLVEKAVAVTVSALLTIRLTWSCIAFRKGIGHLHALAMARALAEHYGLNTWLLVDLADAYGHVPHARLRPLLARLIPNERLVDLIMEMMSPYRRVDGITGPRPKGIPQGSPLSPAIFNAFLNHYLDGPWHRRFPQWPLIRYADDILILTKTRREVKAAHRELRRLLVSAGFQIRDPKTRIVNIDAKSVKWLGHTITRRNGRFMVGIPDDHWQSLEDKLRNRKATTTQGTLSQDVSAFIAYHAPAWRPRDTNNPAILRLEALLMATGGFLLLNFEDGRRSMGIKGHPLFQKAWKRWTRIMSNTQLPMIGASLSTMAGKGRSIP